MDGASNDEWVTVLEQTAAYREDLLGALLKQNFEMILTDGPHAKAEMLRILNSRGGKDFPVVNIERQGFGNNSGIVEATSEIGKVNGFEGARLQGRRANIPRSHLTFYAHVWEGTSGDSVVAALSAGRGQAFALVAPNWASQQQ